MRHAWRSLCTLNCPKDLKARLAFTDLSPYDTPFSCCVNQVAKTWNRSLRHYDQHQASWPCSRYVLVQGKTKVLKESHCSQWLSEGVGIWTAARYSAPGDLGGSQTLGLLSVSHGQECKQEGDQACLEDLSSEILKGSPPQSSFYPLQVRYKSKCSQIPPNTCETAQISKHFLQATKPILGG